MQIIAELGSCFEPGHPETLLDAAKAAMEAGASCVKLQVYDAEELARRRGCEPEKLAPWAMNIKQFDALAKALRGAGIPFGASVFGPTSAITVSGYLNYRAFLNPASQEWQCASLAERVSAYAASARAPLYVSVPPDACLTVGNYWGPLPITWLACVPHYPAAAKDYSAKFLARMFDTLPGRFGVSDHTPDASLVRKLKKELGANFSGKLLAFEKHFCYNESLREKVPDGGPWSLSKSDFGRFALELKS